MTSQESIQVINRLKAEIEWDLSLEYQEAIDEAIEALKKEVPQQPMKSVLVSNNSLYKLYCPTCGIYIGYGNSKSGTLSKFTCVHDRCGHCGQKLQW